jgi:phenylacetic acid degradation operon negative regulatory protein
MSEVAAASGPQHLLLTLLGDYWFPRYDPLPSTALVDLLAAFGISEANTRAALSRMSRKGLLTVGRQGRRTTYALSPVAMRTLHEGTLRIFTFGDRTEAWDGHWTLVAFSIPEENRAVRSTLRIRLGWEGFASLFDGVWVAPGERDRAAAHLLAELDVELATVIVGHASDLVPGGIPTRAWNLEALSRRYEEFVHAFEGVAEQMRADEVADREALIFRTALIDAWREFPGVDPELPGALLPLGWPQPRARRLFAEIYDGLGHAATERIRALLGAHDAALAEYAAHHTSSDALHLCEQAVPHLR